MADNVFDSPFLGAHIRDQVKNPNIIVGEYSYYSGYYHGHGFDECARYLESDRETDDKLIIGRFCSIGSGAVFIMAGNQGHRADWISTYPFHFMPDPKFAPAGNGYLPAGDTVVGSDVWIGTEALVTPGITIGHGAVLAARSVVTRDVEPYAVVGGNPARLIRHRFPESEVALLLEMKWWDWPKRKIVERLDLLTTGHVAALYRYWKSWNSPAQAD